MSGPVVALLVAADAASTRRVYAVVIALVVIGVAFAGLAWWLVRRTRVDRELLAPLERMSERSWLKQDPAERRRLLDEVRPTGAEPLEPAPSAPDVDEEFAPAGPPQRSLDDLAEVRVPSERPGPLPPPDVPPAPADASEPAPASDDAAPDVEEIPVDARSGD